MIKRGKRYSILSAVGLCVRCSAGVSVAVRLLYLFQGLTPALLTLATGAFIDAAIGLLRCGVSTSELRLDFQPTSRSSGGAATDRCAREVRNGDGGEGR